MCKIIPFPGKYHHLFGGDTLIVEPLENQQPVKSKVDFTCVSCNNITKFELTNAVFKTLEVFCSKCGAGWKISNPLFKKTQARSE